MSVVILVKPVHVHCFKSQVGPYTAPLTKFVKLRYQVLTVVRMKITVFWYLVLYSMI